MLDGLDDVDWGAFRSGTEVRDLIRGLAAGRDVWSDLVSEMFQHTCFGGYAYPVAAAAVPFLVEIADARPAERGDTFSLLWMISDAELTEAETAAAIRAALTVSRDRIAAYLGDADSAIREAAASVFGMADGDPGPLWARWSVERDAAVRVALLLALGRRDPHRGVAAARHALLHEEPGVRLAAAVVIVHNGSGLPDGGVEALVTALELRTEDLYAPHVKGDGEIITNVDDATAAALIGRMCASSLAYTRQEGVFDAAGRMRALRPAVAQLLPLVSPLLDDPVEDVRDWAVRVLRVAGPAVAAHADALARVAATFPTTVGESRYSVESDATRTLMLIGDPRWVDLVAPAVAAGDDRVEPGRMTRWNEAVGDAIRPHLSGPARGFFGRQIRLWGAKAAPLRPDLEALLPEPVAALALWHVLGDGAIAPTGMVEGLRASPDELDAAIGVWRLASDPGPAVAVLRRMLATEVDGPMPLLDAPMARLDAPMPRLDGPMPLLDALMPQLDGPMPRLDRPMLRLDAPMPRLDGPGEDLRPLLGDASALLTGTAAKAVEDCGAQVLAALIVWRVTGSASTAAQTLDAILRRNNVAAYRAAELVADLAEAFDPAAPGLRPALRQRLHDPLVRVAAARALWCLGDPVDELVPAILAAVGAGDGVWDGVPLLVEMRATAAVPELRELAERRNRLPVDPRPDDVVWADEAARAELRAAIEALESATGTGLTHR